MGFRYAYKRPAIAIGIADAVQRSGPLDVTCVVVSAVDDRFVARNLVSPAATLPAAAAEALATFAVGPSLPFAAGEQFGRFQSEADIQQGGV